MKEVSNEKGELSFSQRKGLKPVKNIIQINSMDDDLRNSLWNVMTSHLWNKLELYYDLDLGEQEVTPYLKDIWCNYFKKPVDILDNKDWDFIHLELKTYFLGCEWFEAYDFLEFIANIAEEEMINQEFMELCNAILERELSAYRFIGGKITQITSKEEIIEIEEALDSTRSIKPVNDHLKQALNLLSDRKSPDYRNSIKESISAVEAICRIITENPKATLGDALNIIEKQGKVELHGALKKSFSSLYGYTSSADGIRHALLDESSLDFEDAKFMLVSCSAFINYLIVKCSKAGIKL